MNKNQLVDTLSDLQDELVDNVKNGGNYDFHQENDMLKMINTYLLTVTKPKE